MRPARISRIVSTMTAELVSSIHRLLNRFHTNRQKTFFCVWLSPNYRACSEVSWWELFGRGNVLRAPRGRVRVLPPGCLVVLQSEVTSETARVFWDSGRYPRWPSMKRRLPTPG
jgi:hypothetical protein